MPRLINFENVQFVKCEWPPPFGASEPDRTPQAQQNVGQVPEMAVKSELNFSTAIHCRFAGPVPATLDMGIGEDSECPRCLV
jgi:hypothetical protein